MQSEYRIVALVPMRHDSERVPGKNYRLFGGSPLYQRILETLLTTPMIDKVVVNTDSPFIMERVTRDFPSILLIERPPHLRGGETPMNDILLYDVNTVRADYYLQTHSTNPLLRSATINKALEHFLQNYPIYDSLFSVTKVQTRLWDQLARPINHNQAILLRTQDLPPVYEENSCIYIFTRQTLEQKRNRIGDRPILFEIDRIEALDIDEETDFQMAEYFYFNNTNERG